MIPSGNKSFTAADIERYHKGKMSLEERHALEKAALDDPFLADALEGYAHTETPAKDLAVLQKRLNEKTGRKKIIPLFARPWMRSAAVIILVVAGGWLVYRTLSPENKSVALEPKQTNKNEVVAAPGITVADSTAAGNESLAVDSTILVSASPKNQRDKKNITERSTSPATLNDVSFSDVASNTDTSTKALSNYSFKDYRNQQDNARVSGNVAFNAKQNNATNAGRVPDPTTTNNATAHPQAYYELNVRSDSVFGKDYAMKKAERSKTTDTIEHFNIVLKEQQAPPADVVVIGHGSQKKQTADARMRGVVLDTLEPAEGWTNFDDYIANNLQRPAELQQIKQPTGGEVQLSFDVNDLGEPVNIKVEKSLCAQCDDEAIRLLKQGPKWKKKKNKKGKVTIRF
jgi:hypothetical protein